MKRIAFGFTAAALLATSSASAVSINEIRIDDVGTDTAEFFELYGTPGASLNNLTYIVIGDGTGGSGVIDGSSVISLAGQSLDSNGFFLAIIGAGDGSNDYGVTGDLNLSANVFENGDNVTHLLVDGFTGAAGNDLDTNDDGILDVTPWTSIIDSVGLVQSITTGELIYSSTTVGPDGSFVPGLAYRTTDGTGDWAIGTFLIGDGGYDGTPGFTNVPEPSSLALLGLGGLLIARRRRD